MAKMSKSVYEKELAYFDSIPEPSFLQPRGLSKWVPTKDEIDEFIAPHIESLWAFALWIVDKALNYQLTEEESRTIDYLEDLAHGAIDVR